MLDKLRLRKIFKQDTEFRNQPLILPQAPKSNNPRKGIAS